MRGKSEPGRRRTERRLAAVLPAALWGVATLCGCRLRERPSDPGDDATPRGLNGPSFSVVSSAVEDLTGRRPTSVRELLEEHRDELIESTR